MYTILIILFTYILADTTFKSESINTSITDENIYDGSLMWIQMSQIGAMNSQLPSLVAWEEQNLSIRIKICYRRLAEPRS